MLIKFSPEFIIYTSGLSSVRAEGSTVAACLDSTFKLFPQLLLFLTDNNSKEAEKSSLKLNGEYLFEETAMWLATTDEDILEFGRDVPEGESGGMKVLVGAAIIATAFATGGLTLAAAPAFWSMGTLALGIGSSLILGGLTELIVGTPSLPGVDVNAASPTYAAFSGVQNTTAPGTPVSIVYGTHRVAGHLTSAYQKLYGVNSYLFVQVALSEGEIEGITDIEINKRPAAEYQNVSAYGRLGTSDQTQLPAPLVTTQSGEDSNPDYNHTMPANDWHTVLIPKVITGITLTFTLGTPDVPVEAGSRFNLVVADATDTDKIIYSQTYTVTDDMRYASPIPEQVTVKQTITFGASTPRLSGQNLKIQAVQVESTVFVTDDPNLAP